MLAGLVVARVHLAYSVLRRRCARRGMQSVVHRFKLVELTEQMRMKKTDQFSTAVMRPIAIRSATTRNGQREKSMGEWNAREMCRDIKPTKGSNVFSNPVPTFLRAIAN